MRDKKNNKTTKLVNRGRRRKTKRETGTDNVRHKKANMSKFRSAVKNSIDELKDVIKELEKY